MRDQLTADARLRTVLQFISQRLTTYGYAPSVRDVAANTGRSVERAHAALKELESLGYLEVRRAAPHQTGSMVVTDAGKGFLDE